MRPKAFQAVRALVSRVRNSLPTCRAGHPAWRRCSSLKYSRYSRSSRLARRAPRSGILASYFALGTLALTVLSLSVARSAAAQVNDKQLNENCTVSVLNRNVRVRPDGSWVLPNVPANFGLVRARVTCVVDGKTISGESEPFLIPANGVVNRPHIVFGRTTAIPRSVSVTTPVSTLTSIGASARLTVTARYADGSSKDVTSGFGTQYTISNRAIATVSADGLVQAVKSGTVVIQATLEGASGIASIRIAPAGVDTDGDGIPDEYEIAHGLNPNNPVDAQEDPDHDGLTNLQEYQLGTDPQNADTDGDGLSDGQEIARGTNPLLWDTDGDGISDGLEVGVGTNPLDGSSFNLAAVLSAIHITPASFVLTFNTIEGEASARLKVTGTMLDGRTIDVTARGVNFASSDLNICNFGATQGQVFAGQSGSCTITTTIAALSATSTGTVRTFAPTALSFVSIPGFANSVDVSGDFAYVAAGSAGLQIVDVSSRTSPRIAASLALPGNANDVKLDGTRAYVAAGRAGLHIVDISNPLSPRLLGSTDTPGDAFDVRASGNLAFVADGPTGLQIIDVSSPDRPRIVGSLALPGVAHGVAVNGQIAVVAAGFAGLQVVDVTNPARPRILGGVGLPDDAKDVVLNGSFAYVADYQASLQVVDLTNPAAPRVVGSTPTSLGGILMDVATSPPFVFSADVFFVNGVPIVDATLPNNPVARARLDFPFRDDNGTGIAVDGTYVYLTASRGIVENGVSEDTRLYIGQYRALEDLKGVAPTVTLVAPADGATFIEGETIPLSATATDDVAVVSLNFLVDGAVVFTDTSAPYQFSITAPVGAGSLTLSANAVDLGSNVGESTVRVNVIPDPLTTVVGRVVGRDLQPLAGVNVGVLGHTGTTGLDGTFSIVGVPTRQPVLIVSASLSANGTTLTGFSEAAPPVRGGTTDVGDIVAAATSFVTDLGTLTPRCDFCDVTVQLPFEFTIAGKIHTHININNGYLWTDDGDYLRAFCCNLTTGGGGGGGGGVLGLAGALAVGAIAAPADSTAGLYVNDQLPGRFVVTWNREFTFNTGQELNTIQVILFADGRIQYGYHGVSPRAVARVALFPSNRNSFRRVDFSATPSLTAAAQEAVYEDFDPSGNRFDLDGGFVIFTPSADGADRGYEIHPVPDVVTPVCTITSPVDGSTLFEGEVLSVDATATDDFAVSHVTLRSSIGGLDVDLPTAPYRVPFTVPVGVTQVTFTATAYDAWRNAGVCTSTVSVVAGPAPTLTITSPLAGAVLTAGATIPITIDAANRVPVGRVDLFVNGAPFFTDSVSPFQFLFTVPAGVTSLSLSASATDTVGKVGTSPAVSVAVAPDPLTTVQGRVVDRSATPIGGADLTLDLHGVNLEIFNFDTALAELPDLTGRTPDRVTIASAVNLRNPGGTFGADPFGFGASVSHAARLTAKLQTIGVNTYTFTLGVNAGGRLIVNGTTVVDIPTANGQFQQATGTIGVPLGSSVAIEILTFDNGNPEVQLSYAPAGVDELKIAPTSELTPTIVPYHATSQTDGTFAIAGVPTTLGDVIVRASTIIDGRTARGHSVPTAPVPAGVTNVGDVVIHGVGIIGYYDLSANSGVPQQLPPITIAGQEAVNVGDLNTADLSQFDVLFVQNPDNSGYSGAFRNMNNLAKVHQFVANGGILVFHDRHVSSAATILPGTPGTFVRAFNDAANIDIVDDTTLVTNGPGGRLNNASLDGGNASSHGWIEAPAGAHGILSQGNPNHLVTYSYTFGLGKVVYSTIPLDFYLNDSGPANVNANMKIYAANVVAYANELR